MIESGFSFGKLVCIRDQHHRSGWVQYLDLFFSVTPLGDATKLPPFLGATLRGLFGYTLKRTVCQIAHGRCGECLLQTACAYPAVFDGLAPPGRTVMRKYQNIPQPFVLLVDAPQDDRQSTAELRFGVRLFGPAIRYWPYVVHAFKTAEDSGLGRARVAYRVERVTGPPDGLALWVRDRNDWIQPTPQVANLCEPSLPEQCRIRWRFETPLLLSKDGVRAPQDLSGLDLVLAGRRRFKIISAFYGSDLPTECTQCQYLDASAFSTSESNLRFWSFTRYSGRQQRRMRLGGLLGEVVIEGPWAEAGSWLSIASILHLGKATSFGFGRVSWEVV